MVVVVRKSSIWVERGREGLKWLTQASVAVEGIEGNH